MSEKKAAAKAAAETKPEGQAMVVTQKAKGPAPVMYVGPTIAGVAIQFTVYTEMPEGAKAAAESVPVIRNLFIPIEDYPKAHQMLRDGKGYIASAYKKALEYKEGGTKK